jgi:hypothetical protein
MAGRGRWSLGLVALLGAGCQAEDIRSRPEEREAAARSAARQAAVLEAPPTPELAVRFVGAASSEVLPGERSRQGDPSWRKGKPARAGELEVLTSAQSALAGERISVEVSTREHSMVRAEVFRLGFYGGAGALKVWSGGPYRVSTLPPCPRPSSGPRAPCPERQTFAFQVAEEWAPGLYLVKVMRSDGRRSFTSLMVRSRRGAKPPP